MTSSPSLGTEATRGFTPPNAAVAALADLQDRWARARRSALLAAGAAGPIPAGEAAEESAVRALDPDAAEAALSLVFDYSRLLGQGFRRFHRWDGDPAALGQLLSALGLPCLGGAQFSALSFGDLELRRAGCAGSGTRRACDHFREATDGLVLGLSDGAVRHRRHRSRGHGQEACVDVLLAAPTSPRRFGPLPRELAAPVEALARRLERLCPGLGLEAVGLSESTLCLRWSSPSEGLAAEAMVQRALARDLPGQAWINVSPRPVLAAGA